MTVDSKPTKIICERVDVFVPGQFLSRNAMDEVVEFSVNIYHRAGSGFHCAWTTAQSSHALKKGISEL